MENKKYIDKVLDHLVRGTRLDYEKELLFFPFSLRSTFYSFSCTILLFYSFSDYCKNTFGLTEEETEYVWKEYKSIIKDKISKRES